LPGKRVAILQSSYIPWKGYFDIINFVDEFILYDDRQYTKRDWRNRNRIKTAGGAQWLTIPVQVKGRYTQRIDEVIVSDQDWAVRHWRSITQSYSPAAHFKQYREEFEPLYTQVASSLARLSEINRVFISAICRILNIRTAITASTDYSVSDADRTGNLVALCASAGATTYLSGPSARDYIDTRQFEAAGISVEYMDYSGYREYPQLHPPFEHAVSIVDLIFNVGPKAATFMKSFR
jgi:WbqC-like protein